MKYKLQIETAKRRHRQHCSSARPPPPGAAWSLLIKVGVSSLSCTEKAPLVCMIYMSFSDVLQGANKALSLSRESTHERLSGKMQQNICRERGVLIFIFHFFFSSRFFQTSRRNVMSPGLLTFVEVSLWFVVLGSKTRNEAQVLRIPTTFSGHT